jgi:uncharacterized RDD family membrane protein YckC
MENQFLDSNLDATPQYSQYAGFWQRFLAVVIDYIIMYIPGLIINSALGVNAAMTDLIGTEDPEVMMNFLTGTFMVAALLSIVVNVAYYAYFESSEKQATFGKQALGLVVTNLNGERISFLNAVGRYFARVISAFTLAIGYLIQPFTEKKQALHDMIAGTLVYKK